MTLERRARAAVPAARAASAAHLKVRLDPPGGEEPDAVAVDDLDAAVLPALVKGLALARRRGLDAPEPQHAVLGRGHERVEVPVSVPVFGRVGRFSVVVFRHFVANRVPRHRRHRPRARVVPLAQPSAHRGPGQEPVRPAPAPAQVIRGDDEYESLTRRVRHPGHRRARAFPLQRVQRRPGVPSGHPGEVPHARDAVRAAGDELPPGRVKRRVVDSLLVRLLRPHDDVAAVHVNDDAAETRVAVRELPRRVVENRDRHAVAAARESDLVDDDDFFR